MSQCSIDRLTILGESWFSPSWIQRSIDRWEDIKHIGLAKYPYAQQIKFQNDSIFLQLADESADVPTMRLDFNPNKVSDMELHRFMFMMKDAKVSRYDVAIDYKDDLSDCMWLTPSTQSRAAYWGQDGQLETIYLGSQKSDSLIRIYNKNKEQGIVSDDPWWRLEKQVRPDRKHEVLNDRLFDGIYGLRDNEGYSLSDRATIFYARHNPNAFCQMSGYQRQRCRKLARENKCSTVTPADVYKQEKEHLQADLAGILGRVRKIDAQLCKQV